MKIGQSATFRQEPNWTLQVFQLEKRRIINTIGSLILQDKKDMMEKISKNEELEKILKELKQKIKKLNVLMVGEIGKFEYIPSSPYLSESFLLGAGKSSFVNSVLTAFSDHVIERAAAGTGFSGPGGSTKTVEVTSRQVTFLL